MTQPAQASDATIILSRTKGGPVTREFAVAGLVTGIVSMFWAAIVVFFAVFFLFIFISIILVAIGGS